MAGMMFEGPPTPLTPEQRETLTEEQVREMEEMRSKYRRASTPPTDHSTGFMSGVVGFILGSHL